MRAGRSRRPPAVRPRGGAPAGTSSGQLAGGPPGRRILCGSPSGQVRQGVSPTSGLRAAASATVRTAVSITSLRRRAAHQVAAHHGQVLGDRLDQHHLGPARAHALGLVPEPPARGRPHGARPRGRATPPPAPRSRRGGGVEADHQVELLAGQQVEVGGRAHAAVHVARPPIAHRAVEAGDGARGGHGAWPARPAARPRGRRPRAGRWRSRTRRPSKLGWSTQPLGTARRRSCARATRSR